MNDDGDHRLQLIRILQNAYSGELAAAYAYRGHWKSVRRASEREAIRKIEREEWTHRKEVGGMLGHLGALPLRRKEARMWLTGRTIGALCHVIGWFLPMYFAGRLENGNVEEYEHAAMHARKLGFADFERELQIMAKVEREHEVFFAGVIAGHRLLPVMRRVFGW